MDSMSRNSNAVHSLGGMMSRVIACSLILWLSHSQLAGQTRQVPVESLIYDLKNPDPGRRKDAVIALGNNKVKRAIPDLVAAAPDPDPAVRREIVIALDRMLDAGALPAFLNLINDPEKDIREKCIQGLINLYLPQESGLVVTLTKVGNFFNPWSDEWGDVVIEPGIVVEPNVISSLGTRLQDDDEGIRTKAARAIGILKGKQAIPALLTSLREERSNGVRFEVVRSLRKIGDPGVAGELINYLGYNDSKVRNEAVFAVGRLRHNQAVPELTRLYEKESKLPSKSIDKSYRERLLEAIAFIADPASKDMLLKERNNPVDELRLHAYEGLARIGDPAIVTEVSRDRLRERDPRIRAAQAYALYRMGRKEYLEEMVAALSNRKSHSEARQYLVELRTEELPDLYDQIRNRDVDVRESLAEIFGIIGDSRAIPALQELSKDRRGQVAPLANQAQRRILARNAAAR